MQGAPSKVRTLTITPIPTVVMTTITTTTTTTMMTTMMMKTHSVLHTHHHPSQIYLHVLFSWLHMLPPPHCSLYKPNISIPGQLLSQYSIYNHRQGCIKVQDPWPPSCNHRLHPLYTRPSLPNLLDWPATLFPSWCWTAIYSSLSVVFCLHADAHKWCWGNHRPLTHLHCTTFWWLAIWTLQHYSCLQRHRTRSRAWRYDFPYLIVVWVDNVQRVWCCTNQIDISPGLVHRCLSHLCWTLWNHPAAHQLWKCIAWGLSWSSNRIIHDEEICLG